MAKKKSAAKARVARPAKSLKKSQAAAAKKKPAPVKKKTAKRGSRSPVPGTREKPWKLKTPSGQSTFLAYRDATLAPPALVVVVGTTELRYHLCCIDDLHAMLKARGDWVPLGSADEQKLAAEGTVEAWARSPHNPVGGWYGIIRGLRGRFANYVPPVLKLLGLAEVEEKARDNRMRAK
jgi:hypothetical protein